MVNMENCVCFHWKWEVLSPWVPRITALALPKKRPFSYNDATTDVCCMCYEWTSIKSEINIVKIKNRFTKQLLLPWIRNLRFIFWQFLSWERQYGNKNKTQLQTKDISRFCIVELNYDQNLIIKSPGFHHHKWTTYTY